MISPVSAYNWSGLYIGGNIGGTWAETSGSILTAPNIYTPNGVPFPSGSASTGSLAGGAQIGYNFQSGSLVYGVEGDIELQNWNHQTNVATPVGANGLSNLYVPGDVFNISSNWQASLRARVGYAFDRFLVYATGGIAFTQANASASFIALAPPAYPYYAAATSGSGGATMVGGTLGAGFEYALTRELSAGAEARYTWYGSHNFTTGDVQYSSTVYPIVTQNYNLNNGIVLLKLNYKLY